MRFIRALAALLWPCLALASPGSALAQDLSPLFVKGHPSSENFATTVNGYGALAESRHQVSVYVARNDGRRIGPGARGEVEFGQGGQARRVVPAKVVSVLRDADPKTGQAIVTLEVPPQKLPARSYAQARIEIASHRALAAPSTAVVVDHGHAYVYVEDPAHPGDFKRKEVRLGSHGPRLTEILAGVAATDTLLVQGALEWDNGIH